jgi:hypothetical protein
MSVMNIKDLYQAVKSIETDFGSTVAVNRSEYVAVAVGAIAASILPLPTSPVNNPTNHWILQCESTLKTLLSQLNEMYVIDIKQSLTIARQVYLARYRRVYDVALIVSELNLLMPDHVSKMPDGVKKMFEGMSENQKHGFGNHLTTVLTNMLESPAQ